MNSLLRFVLTALISLLAIWQALILYYAPILPENLRLLAVIGSLILFLLAFLKGRLRRISRMLLGLSMLVTICSWIFITPSLERDWAEEYKLMPYFEINEDIVTVRNVRNFQHRKQDQSLPRYYDKVVKLSELTGLDIFVSYWAGKPIAHIMISFGFNEKDFIAVSIETRREKDEGYSTLAGFFRNFELIYVVADERDVISLRTTYREPAERVHLLRTNMALATARRFFLDYAKSINQLSKQPEFYNTIVTNCTSQVFFHTRVNKDSLPYNWKLFLSGYVPDYLQDINALAPGYTLEHLLELGKVNQRSINAADSDNYSVLIRQGVPRPSPAPD